jgi:hypothetical protein
VTRYLRLVGWADLDDPSPLNLIFCLVTVACPGPQRPNRSPRPHRTSDRTALADPAVYEGADEDRDKGTAASRTRNDPRDRRAMSVSSKLGERGRGKSTHLNPLLRGAKREVSP